MSNLLQSITGLILTWVRSDRVRIRPTEGRLLSLQVGDRFVFERSVYRVVQRHVRSDCQLVTVEYTLDDGDVECSLIVRKGSTGAPPHDQVRGWMMKDNEKTELFEEEICVPA